MTIETGTLEGYTGKELYLDFSAPQALYCINVNGWRAKLLNIVLVILGHHWTLWLFKKLPTSTNDHGILAWSPVLTYMEGEWALMWQTKSWYSFIVAKACTDTQLRLWREGQLVYPS